MIGEDNDTRGRILPVQLSQFSAFDGADDTNAGPKWKVWMTKFNNLMAALQVGDTDEAKKYKKTLLIFYMGERCSEIYDTIKENNEESYDEACKKLNEYFLPKENKMYERYLLRTASQEEGESILQYSIRLKAMAAKGRYPATMEEEVMLQIIQSCRSSSLRQKALEKDDLTLDELIKMGSAKEAAKSRATVMESGNTQGEINKVKSSRLGRRDKMSQKKCWKCGGNYPHSGVCPAKGKKCNFCDKEGHFAKCCKSKQYSNKKMKMKSVKEVKKDVEVLTSDSSDDTVSDKEYVNSLRTGCEKRKPKKANSSHVYININGVNCKLLADTGADVNIVDENTYCKIERQSKSYLVKTDLQLYAFGSRVPLNLLGKADVSMKYKDQKVETQLYVTKGNTGCILSGATAENLKVLKWIREVKASVEDRRLKVMRKYQSLFEGVGKLKNFQLKLNIDRDIVPVDQKHRRVPFKTREKVEKAVKKLCEEDICEKVESTPTPWVSPIVIVPRASDPNNIRICVDMRAANKAIKRVKHPMPTIHELIHDLNGSKVFSKLDLNQGYHQVELHPESRYVTTFSTHMGLHQYKRLNFGVNAASEIFQYIIQQVLEGLEGVKNISDDIYIFSKDVDDHEKHVNACLRRLQEKGLTLNKKKCEFFKTSISFFGNVFSEKGISPDPKKIKAIQDANRPTDKSEVRSLLGMANYVQRFIPNLATIVEPLRNLIRKETKFEWTDMCEKSWKSVKESLTSDMVMSYFDVNAETQIVVDASPVGLGAMLTQMVGTNGKKEIKVVAYASRSLNEIECRYSQVEREALAVRWSIEQFHLYVHGLHFTVITDHKPLVSIFSNVQAKPSARIERWCLRLQQYDFVVRYEPGSKNPADYMSRHPLKSMNNLGTKITEGYVNHISGRMSSDACTLKEIEEATMDDQELQDVIQCLKTGNWKCCEKKKNMKLFRSIESELCVTNDGILLRNQRIVIPASLRKRIIRSAHEGHQGVAKTKALIRSKVWFPKLDFMVENLIRDCSACSAVVKHDHIQPLKMSDLPDGPWQSLSVDFCGPFPGNVYCLVVIDEYSRYPVVENVYSTSSKAVIPVLDKLFSMLGFPVTLKSDNGPPFQSSEFKRFMKACGIKHRKIIPLWPRANAQAEGFMKPLQKAIKTAIVDGKSWKQEMYKFLRNYRATPHSTTNRTPAELLFRLKMKTILPEVPEKREDDELRLRDSKNKAIQKRNGDKRLRTHLASTFKIGDKVLLRQEKRNKLTPAYHLKPMIVTDIKGSMVTAKSTSLGQKTRNSSFFKKVNFSRNEDEQVSDYEEWLSDEETTPHPIGERTSNSSNRPKRNRAKPAYLNDYVTM